MKTKIFGGIAIVAIAVAVAFNVSVSNQKQDAASLLALANVEALADGETMTDEEYTKKTGCVACWDDHNCTSDDGTVYSFSHRE